MFFKHFDDYINGFEILKILTTSLFSPVNLACGISQISGENGGDNFCLVSSSQKPKVTGADKKLK